MPGALQSTAQWLPTSTPWTQKTPQGCSAVALLGCNTAIKEHRYATIHQKLLCRSAVHATTTRVQQA